MPKFIEKSPRGHSCMRASVGGKSVVTPQTFASQTMEDPLEDPGQCKNQQGRFGRLKNVQPCYIQYQNIML